MKSLDRASLGAVLRHKLRLLLDRATSNELGEFGDAIPNRDRTAISRLGSLIAAIGMQGAAKPGPKRPDRQPACQISRKMQDQTQYNGALRVRIEKIRRVQVRCHRTKGVGSR